MQKILYANTMKKADMETINCGVSSLVLMERVAQAVYDEVFKHEKICILVGPGNNGGDGLAIAYLLYKNLKKEVKIVLFSEKLSNDSHYFIQKLEELNFNKNNFIDIAKVDNTYDIIIDCVFGNGLSRELNDSTISFIKHINSLNVKKIGVDLPTGINADNGLKMQEAIKCDITIVVQDYKVGHFLNDAKDYVGELKKVDIGIKTNIYDANLVEVADIKKIFPKRKQNIDKYSSGRVTIIGGSKHYIGAPLLAEMGLSALRVGAGLSTIAVPSSLKESILTRIIDATICPLDECDGCIKFNESEINKIIGFSNVIVFGPGVSLSSEITKVLKYILLNFNKSVVIDADGIYHFKKLIDEGIKIASNVILTPHIKEAAKLFSVLKDEIKIDPIKEVKLFAKKNNVVCLLKGPSTIVSDGKSVYVSNKGTSAQSKAGNGDFLSGVIGGIESFNNDLISSAYAATYLVGMAAENKEKEFTSYSLLASDLIEPLKNVINSFN